MNSTTRVPVHLVTGFLGSGKTTLINAVLRDPDFAGTLVVVNEFGEVGLDHLLVSSADDQVVLLPSGCLCCAASGSLRDTLIDLFARRGSGSIAAFSRIIVETSGLANPGPLVATLIGDSAISARCRLAGVLTLVDARHGVDTLDRYEEARQQVALADQLLLTKAEAPTSHARATFAALTQRLQRLNPHAPLASRHPGDSPAAYFPTSGVAGAPASLAPSPGRGHAMSVVRSAPHGTAFERIGSHTLSLPQVWSWEDYAHLTRALDSRLGPRLLRCKGLLSIGDDLGPRVVQGVRGYFAPPERLPRWPEGVPRGFLVCITDSVSPGELDALVGSLLPLAESHCP